MTRRYPGAARPPTRPPEAKVAAFDRLDQSRRLGRAGGDDVCSGAALRRQRVRLCRARGAALSLVCRPAAGSSARHHRLDGAVTQRGFGVAARRCLGLAAAPYDRRSRRVAARSFGVPLRRSAAGSARGRGYDPLIRVADGVTLGPASALVGMPGPPALIYLLLAGAAASTVRATLLAFFALSYGATLISHAVTIGIPGPTWIAAGILVPFAFLGGLAGRPIGDRLGAKGFRLLAIALLAAAGLYRSPARSLALQFTADRNRAAANSPDAITPHSRDAIAKGEYYAPTACARLPL